MDSLPGSQLRASAELCLGGVESEDEVQEEKDAEDSHFFHQGSATQSYSSNIWDN